MGRVRVTRSYQITIPKEIREASGIKIGDYVEVYLDANGRIVVEKVRRERMRLASGRRLTLEEIDELVAKGLGETLAGGGD
ncbi:MAG: AbrB/MazE/SpoVT family DNA-binding domain-containing protein [Thermofilaceae archaeon]|nr:AbrB/MazE/SpoVT family DNA-binding domain-containing protein [Thermofilaceae archaeon]MCX8181235.1 AbrB/MazE/SpoVT family DNA-binding domain-containing protein [Thermofilaceae archaeon]MDW8003546.1 AbrB/MazE/SpoVT family DNA-binding domain-containing protein [Thermofilaceae archaeon]